jgi:hypothetical protein
MNRPSRISSVLSSNQKEAKAMNSVGPEAAEVAAWFATQVGKNPTGKGQMVPPTLLAQQQGEQERTASSVEKPGRGDWSLKEIEILRQGWSANRSRFEISADIATAGYCRSPKACLNKASELGLPPRDIGVLRRITRSVPLPDEPMVVRPVRPHENVEKQRKCLACREDFRSTHFGERICVKCKSENGDGGDEYRIVITRR